MMQLCLEVGVADELPQHILKFLPRGTVRYSVHRRGVRCWKRGREMERGRGGMAGVGGMPAARV